VGKVGTRREVTLYLDGRQPQPVNYSLAVRRLAEATVRPGDPWAGTLGLASVVRRMEPRAMTGGEVTRPACGMVCGWRADGG
jgi:hypothetical protein